MNRKEMKWYHWLNPVFWIKVTIAVFIVKAIEYQIDKSIDSFIDKITPNEPKKENKKK